MQRIFGGESLRHAHVAGAAFGVSQVYAGYLYTTACTKRHLTQTEFRFHIDDYVLGVLSFVLVWR